MSRSEPLGRSGLAVTITTPKNVTVNVDGGTKTVASTGPTVADALQQLEVTLGAQDRVNPAPETPLTEGLAVTINRVEKKCVSETQAVAFGVTNQDDANLAKGTRKTITKGVAGGRASPSTRSGSTASSSPAPRTAPRSPRTRSARSSRSAPRPPTPPPPRPDPARDPARAAVGRQHLGCGPQPRQRGDVSNRLVRVRRQLAHQHRQRLLRRLQFAQSTRLANGGADLPRAPTWPPGSSRSRSPTGSTPSPASNLGLQALTEGLQHAREAPGMTDSPELPGAARVRELAARLGLRPTKQWGQNFVVDANTVRRIVRLAGVGPEDVVVESVPASAR